MSATAAVILVYTYRVEIEQFAEDHIAKRWLIEAETPEKAEEALRANFSETAWIERVTIKVTAAPNECPKWGINRQGRIFRLPACKTHGKTCWTDE